MKSRGRRVGSVVLGVGLVAGVLAGPAHAGPRVPAGKHTTIATVKTSLGRVVSNARGRAMFRFMKDPKNSSLCMTACHAVWPPVLSTKAAKAGPHISAKHLGRTSAGQVTYYHHPLYFFVGDPKPGKTKGDGTVEFGAKWFLVSPTGKPVKPAGPTGPTGPAAPTTAAVVSLSMGKPGLLTSGSTSGPTLYELTNEQANPGTYYCTGGCLSTWPPLLTTGAADETAAGGADGTKLGTVSRVFDTGTFYQVTYNGYPLYTYAGDHSAGDTNGQGHNGGAGGYWYDMLATGSPNV